ncbi:hypothetical protein DENSPDRAFT_783049 [Dentipellis sp. KUC8613]|nr:hypothetical protein DENSPDRAFT_783049 [Dentipellis sp. KUC8613]
MSKKVKPSKDTKYEFRDVVLAKVRGYPPWPGMVVDPDSVPADVSRERPQNKKSNFYCVRFFPKGEHAWLVSKDISKLLAHEIEAYINEPFKRSGELLTGYRVALNPTKWEEEIEAQLAEAADAEANAEVDQLENESDSLEADADGDEEERKPKAKKRKRESEVAPAKSKAKAKTKKDSAEPAPKKKAAAAGKGKKNGIKSKAMVESEDDGERGEAEGDDAEDAGPSKQTSPPPAKKVKREKDDDPMASDPEAVKVKDWRTKLQKTFLNEHKEPKPEDMPTCDELFTTIEKYDKMNLSYLSYSKIGKVMRHIYLQPAEKIPRDEEFQFRERARVLINKWQAILNAAKEAEGGAPAANGNGTAKKEADAAPAPAAPAADTDTKMEDAPAAAVPAPAAPAKEPVQPPTEDAKMDTEEPAAAPAPAAAPETNGATDTALADGDTSVLADVTMSEA